MSPAGQEDVLLERMRSLHARLAEVEQEHLRRTGPGLLVLAVLVTLVAGLAAVPLVSVPAVEEEYRWVLLPGVPGLGLVLFLAWSVIRRLLAPYGPLRADHREIRRELSRVTADLYALPPGGSATGASRAWDLRDRLLGGIEGADEAERSGSAQDARAQAHRAAFRNARWTVATFAVAMPTFVAFVVLVVVVPLADPTMWSVMFMGLVLTAGWVMVLRVCALKWRGPRRVTRTVRRGWERELGYIQHRLVQGGAEPWRFPALRTQRLWVLMGRGGRSPAAVLRGLPDGSSALRRFYWRHVGSGVLRLAAATVAVLAIALVIRPDR
ncbi:hypothetical protein GCM10009716_11850 [Streptomyces sodiiphilus]|uniref:Integral membrane protein n=1 Tax=Streptomyces sodiiphilus TaxID=226217 RepID=A0ABN2NWD7_9ACTN